MRREPGPIPLPTSELARRRLPLADLPAGTRLFRVHARHRGPVFFSRGPLGRFDGAAARFGMLYAGTGREAALVETLLREPSRPAVAISEVAARALSVLVADRPLRLVDLTGPGLSRLGLDARLANGPSDTCGRRSDALEAHPDAPDGILYPSRLDPSLSCAALFERAAPALAAEGPPVPLLDLSHEVAAVLDRHGKALDPG